MSTRLVTKAVFMGTTMSLRIPGNDVDTVMKRLRKMQEVRNAIYFYFYNRKSGKMVDARVN